MMLFLCSHNNVNLFDWLNESSLVQQPFMLKKISSNQLDINSFAKKEALSINFYKYLAIDLSAIINDNESFKIAVQSIHMMNPQIRFLYIDIGNKHSDLQETIRSLGDIPIISANPDKEPSEFKTQVTMSLQHIYIHQDAEKEIVEASGKESPNSINDTTATREKSWKTEYTFKNKDIMVAVINAYPRAGATTLSVIMAVYLHSIGAAAAYVECNADLDHLDKIRNSTSGFTTVKENRFDRNGVIYMKNEIPEGMDFVINDMSRIIQDGTETNALAFISNCNTVILCGTSKPYELQEIKKKIQILEGHGCTKICLCLAFTPDNERANLIDIFGSKTVSVYFIEYTPDMFKSNVNSDVIRRILQDYIQEKTADKMLKVF